MRLKTAKKTAPHKNRRKTANIFGDVSKKSCLERKNHDFISPQRLRGLNVSQMPILSGAGILPDSTRPFCGRPICLACYGGRL